ncbi:inverse autotransporter beta domain-containing protein [Proteus vulgaris]|uniref:inverse autotransporter beta domain-containing protein n=1 Tax=Proteus vulgaris TaxID=585 RepID=UPI0018E4C86E|nr:inverse autotransporter beta domain-containing protein [Proteus vulgaris]MBI6527788.1 inverse autotransporter beta domain-containing protein [Proteus vulgaris]
MKTQKWDVTSPISSITKKVTWINIFIQIAFPVSATFPYSTFAQDNQTKNQINNSNNEHLPPITEEHSKLAQLIVNNTNLLNKETNATQYAVNQVTNKASTKIEQWLNQFGNARISLAADNKFTLENSAADFLIPLYEYNQNIIFSQTSYHRKDSRSQINQGLGYRYFTDRFMLGINAFYDHDLTRHHRRVGIGAELWRDYLKFSANHYYRLSNWRTSKSIGNYDERPANGWDLRAEGYLPAYPQLGAKLIFEQYYGKEVGLFNADSRQENPHAYTAGLTYTPIPLITLSADRRMGLHDNSDNTLSVNFQYRLGESFTSQFDPDNVRAMRLLSGNRYDFVDRNNDIVLEYKKKATISFSFSPNIMGYSKEEKALDIKINSTYPIKNIEWSASKFLSNGGKINHKQGLNYSVTLPAYISGTPQQNTYVINAIAIDEKGNRSESAQGKIIVNQSGININNSQFRSARQILIANGHSTQELILTIRDNDNLPVNVEPEKISLEKKSNNTVSSSKLTSFSRLEKGKYKAIITAGTSPEIVSITPSYLNNIFNPIDIQFIANADGATILNGNLSVIKNNALADGKDKNQLKLIVTDKENHPINNYIVKFTADNGAFIQPAGYTSFTGEVIVPITNTHPGNTTIKVKVKEVEYPISVNFTPVIDKDSAYIPRSYLTITPEISPADNVTEKTINLTVIDKNQLPIPNMEVILRTLDQATFKNAILTTDKDGKASTTMVSNVAGKVVVKAEVTSTHNVTEESTFFVNNKANGNITSIIPTQSLYIADGQTRVLFTAVVEDQNHKPLPNVEVNWSTNQDKNIVNIDNETSATNDKGIAVTSISSTEPLDVIVTATIDNDSLSAQPITFESKIASEAHSKISLSATDIYSDGIDNAFLSLELSDQWGNPLPDQKVIAVSDKAIVRFSETKQVSPGHYVIEVTGIISGKVNLFFSVNGINFKTQKILYINDYPSVLPEVD